MVVALPAFSSYLECMSDERMAELAERMARFEGEAKAMEARAETRQHEYKTDIARLSEESAKRDAEMTRHISGLSEEIARRETRMLLAVAGIISLGVVVLSFLIRASG